MSNDQTTPQYDGDVAYTKLTTKVKRGTGTRDQDTTKVTTRHPDPTIADLETPHGPLSLCLACHPTESVLSDSTRRQAHD